MKKLYYVLACLLILSLLPWSVFAEVVEIPADADTYIDNYFGPNTNYGTQTAGYIWYSPSNGWTQRFLVRFNLSAIPSNAVISSAAINLYVFNTWGFYIAPTTSHQITSSWYESTVTWNNFSNSFEGTPLSTTDINLDGWYGWDILNLVKGWMNGSIPNNGVLLKEDNTGLNGADFYTKESFNLTQRPKLVVTYSVPTPPPPVVTNPTPVQPTPVVPTPTTPKKVQKKKVVSGFHKKKCKNKKFHVSHCKKVANKKQAKKNKVFHKKKCSKVITTSSANLKTDLLFKRKR